jgi:hypothetical protein
MYDQKIVVLGFLQCELIGPITVRVWNIFFVGLVFNVFREGYHIQIVTEGFHDPNGGPNIPIGKDGMLVKVGLQGPVTGYIGKNKDSGTFMGMFLGKNEGRCKKSDEERL